MPGGSPDRSRRYPSWTGWTRGALHTPPLSEPQGSTEVLRDLVLGRPCADRISQLPLRDKPPSNPAVSCDERWCLSVGPRIGWAVRRPASDGLGWTHPHICRQLAGRPGAGRSREASLACSMAGWLPAGRHGRLAVRPLLRQASWSTCWGSGLLRSRLTTAHRLLLACFPG